MESARIFSGDTPSDGTALHSPLDSMYASLLCHGHAALTKSMEIKGWLDRMTDPRPDIDLDAEAALCMQLVADYICEHREMHLATLGVGSIAPTRTHYRRPATKADAERTLAVCGAELIWIERAILESLHKIPSGLKDGEITIGRQTLSSRSTPQTQRLLCQFLTEPTHVQRPLCDALWSSVAPAHAEVTLLSEDLAALETPDPSLMPLPDVTSVIAKGAAMMALKKLPYKMPRPPIGGIISSAASTQAATSQAGVARTEEDLQQVNRSD